MKSNEKLAQKMYREIQNIYNNYGGYDYNDTMWCQRVHTICVPR